MKMISRNLLVAGVLLISSVSWGQQSMTSHAEDRPEPTAKIIVGSETEAPSIRHDLATGKVVVRSGRLELVVETKAGLNPRSLRDLKTGRVYADQDYIWSWPGAEFPQLVGSPAIEDRPDGGRAVVLKGRLGSILVQQSFSVSKSDPDAIIESVMIGNPSDKTIVTAGFKCGFAKGLRVGETWLPDATNIVNCPVPYRRETNGKVQEMPLQALTGAVGAEGWSWSDGKVSFLISKFNDDGLEWSLLEPLPRGNSTVLRFGGAGQWKDAHPEGATRLEPGKSFRFGETRLQAVDGDWKQSFYAYRRSMETRGCQTPKGYNPPVHWNELYDNKYYFAAAPICDRHKKDTPELREFLTQGNVKLLNDLYSLEAMKLEAAKAKELGCEALYLDPGWDTGPSHHVWDSERLGSEESFVELMRKNFGLKTSIWVGLGNGGGPFADPFVLPIEARLTNKDGTHPLTLCVASPAFREAKKRLLINMGKKGVTFMMFDSTGWTGPCYDAQHGHSIPSTKEEHVNGVFDILSAVKKACPNLLIELHDPVSGPSSEHYSPTYFRFAKPNSFDCLWGHELMWSSMDDLLSGKAISLYYYNLAYEIPIYLHVNLKQDNANAMMFWWYASTCRHLGVGGKSNPPIWEAQKKAMKSYMEHKRFFTEGAFYGLDETVHAHTLLDLHESVINVFNLEDKPMTKKVRFQLDEIGLGTGTSGQPTGKDLFIEINLPARGHQLLHVNAKPGDEPRITTIGMKVPELVATANVNISIQALGDPMGKENLAYVGNGAKPATVSSAIPGFAQHKPEGLNDGRFGNESGWICAPDDAEPWFQIDLGKEVAVGSVALGRDRRGEFADRKLTTLTIFVSKDGKEWQSIFTTPDLSTVAGYNPTKTTVISFKKTSCRYLKVNVNNGACIDEFEVYGPDPGLVEIPPERLFRQTGSDKVETFAAVNNSYRFDVVNDSTSHMMLAFAACPEAKVSPSIVRLSPGERQNVAIDLTSASKSFSLSYSTAFAPTPFATHSNSYRAYSDGETVQCVPVAAAHHAALLRRTKDILKDSLAKVTDPAMPPDTMIYTPGPFYKHAGIFARDFLYQLEGAGRFTLSADEVKAAVDYMAIKQLTENKKLGGFTYPKGAIPDHVQPDGRFGWGPGALSSDITAHFHRPSLDEAMCFVTLAWHYGYKAGWDAAWKTWFKEKSPRFADAWNSVPRNPKTGLVTQWSTPDHLGANGIAEYHGACVMWGFHDSYGFGGDDVGVSVLACNAARALADMHEHAGDTPSAKTWTGIADAMRDAIRAQFNAAGYLPWGVGKNAPTMASPDITGYAVWSGILTEQQADATSDWFAERYRADKIAGGAADLFHMSAPFRGSVRMARKADDVSPGRHVWPDMRDGNHWENLAYGYNAYQDGGYWYYMSLGVAVALNRKHPDLACEWVGNAYADMASADANPPYERIDGMKPVNNRYNASIGPLMGMGMPAVVSSVVININK